MKRIIALMLVALMLAPALAESGAELKLTAEVTGTRLLEEWEGRTSDECDWLAVDLQLTNWHVDGRSISQSVSGRLVFRDVYDFGAVPAFDGDTIAPLVEKKGSLVFEIPKLVARSLNPDEARLTITVEGDEQPVSLVPASAGPESEGRLEGPGFDDPTGAVLAYLDALNRGEPGEMLSTFALESYVEHADPESFIARVRSFNMTTVNALPLNGDYARGLLLAARYGDLARSLYYQYVQIAMHLDGSVVPVNDPDALRELLDRFAGSPMEQWWGRVEFVEWIEPASLSPIFLTEVNVRNLAIQTAHSGAEDIAVLAAHIRLDGVDAIQTMGCAKYDDRWYNLDLQNNLAILLNLDIYSAGLAYPDEEAEWDGADLIAKPLDPEQSALLESWAASGLAGTCWRLSAVNRPGVEVADAAVGIRQDPDSAVWAELRFMSRGCALAEVRYSPSMDSWMGEGYPSMKVAMVWTNVNGRLEVGSLRSLWSSELDAPECLLDGDELVLRWPDGIQATFRRAAAKA